MYHHSKQEKGDSGKAKTKVREKGEKNSAKNDYE